MKRRLEIARGLLHTPKVLFLDEPTLGLDPQTRNQLWTHVRHLNETEGVTVFLTTHYMDEADRAAQRIAIIDHGKIIAQGSPAELRQQTRTESLEAAFLKLTGTTIRDERGDPAEMMRQMAKMWRRSGAAPSDHGRAHAGRSDDCDGAAAARADRMPARRIQASVVR